MRKFIFILAFFTFISCFKEPIKLEEKNDSKTLISNDKSENNSIAIDNDTKNQSLTIDSTSITIDNSKLYFENIEKKSSIFNDPPYDYNLNIYFSETEKISILSYPIMQSIVATVKDYPNAKFKLTNYSKETDLNTAKIRLELVLDYLIENGMPDVLLVNTKVVENKENKIFIERIE